MDYGADSFEVARSVFICYDLQGEACFYQTRRRETSINKEFVIIFWLIEGPCGMVYFVSLEE